MGNYILAAVICLLFYITSIHATDASIMYGEPDCFGRILADDTTSWIAADSTPYYVGYTCGLTTDNAVTNADNSVTLTVGACGAAGGCSGFNTACGESISAEHTKYGGYTCFMQAQGVAGTIQSCQISSSTRAPFEMIYAAFVGNVTDSIFVGYFSNGQFQSFGMQALGFDASAGSHNVTIIWSPGFIEYYMDGVFLTGNMEQLSSLPRWPNRFVTNFLLDAMDGTNGDWYQFNTNGLPVDRNYDFTSGPHSVIISRRIYVPEYDYACTGDTGFNPGGGHIIRTEQNCTLDDVTSIFDEKFQNGWNNQFSVFADTVDNRKLSNVYTHSGNMAIEWTLYPSPTTSSIWLNSPAEGIYVDEYYALEFWVNGGQTGGQSITIYAGITPDGQLSSPVDINQFLYTGITGEYQWNRIVVPFSAFGSIDPNSNDTILYGFYFSAGNKYGGTVFVDDIYLIQQYPICPNDTLILYDDSLSKSFNNGSWSGTPNTFNSHSTDFVHEGDYAIQWQLNANSGMRFQYAKGAIPTLYTAVSFWLYQSDAASLDQLYVYMTTPNSQAEGGSVGPGPINLQAYYGGNLPYPQADLGDWINIVIPFYEFGATSNTPLQAFAMTWKGSYVGVVYVDSIEFIAEEKYKPPKSTSGATAVGASRFSHVALLVSILLSVMYIL